MRAFVLTAGFALLLPLAAALAADDGNLGSERLIVTPSTGRVGQKFDIECKDFPQPGSDDSVYVVAAGTPDVDPTSVPKPKEKILGFAYAANCYPSGRFIFPFGPFPPGTYEARYMTSLYNDEHRNEVSTRTTFTVTR